MAERLSVGMEVIDMEIGLGLVWIAVTIVTGTIVTGTVSVNLVEDSGI